MKKYYKLALLCWGLSLTNSSAQVGIPTNNPNKNAVLDLNKTDGTNTKGLLLPKVALTAINDASPMTAHVAGMHIWNTATNGTDANAVTPGEYFNDGTKWIRVSSLTDAWIQDGNNNGTTKAIGTNDAFDLPIETNSTERIRITSNGQLLVNTSAPLAGGTTAKLQINNGTTAGALQIKDGTEGFAKVLTSDTNGLATWQSLPGTEGGFVFGQKASDTEMPPLTLYPLKPSGNTQYLGQYITLTPGRWIVYVGQAFQNNGMPISSDLFIRTSLSESKSSNIMNNANYSGASLVSCSFSFLDTYNVATGVLALTVTNTSTFYLINQAFYSITGSATPANVGFAKFYQENYLFATKTY